MPSTDVYAYQAPCPYGFDNASEKMERDYHDRNNPDNWAKDKPEMMNKSMTVEDTLEQRGSVYGEFGVQVQTVAGIVDAMSVAYSMNNGGFAPSDDLRAEWHYLAIKLARIAVNPDHTDSYHDLAGYATLMERERTK